jgi:hypothetical protein
VSERAFVIVECDQQSQEWRRARAGLLTGSRAADALSMRKDGKEAAARRDYRVELVAERLTGEPCEATRSNADTERGILLEPQAIAAYEAHTGQLVQPVGFIRHATKSMGYSPDGVIGDWIGLLEVKCPRPANHLAYLDGGVVPDEHLDQCRHGLYVSGAEWIDFVSYSPIFPEPLRLFVCRLTREQAALEQYAKDAALFLESVSLKESALRGWQVMAEAV